MAEPTDDDLGLTVETEEQRRQRFQQYFAMLSPGQQALLREQLMALLNLPAENNQYVVLRNNAQNALNLTGSDPALSQAVLDAAHTTITSQAFASTLPQVNGELAGTGHASMTLFHAERALAGGEALAKEREASFVQQHGFSPQQIRLEDVAPPAPVRLRTADNVMQPLPEGALTPLPTVSETPPPSPPPTLRPINERVEVGQRVTTAGAALESARHALDTNPQYRKLGMALKELNDPAYEAALITNLSASTLSYRTIQAVPNLTDAQRGELIRFRDGQGEQPPAVFTGLGEQHRNLIMAARNARPALAERERIVNDRAAVIAERDLHMTPEEIGALRTSLQGRPEVTRTDGSREGVGDHLPAFASAIADRVQAERQRLITQSGVGAAQGAYNAATSELISASTGTATPVSPTTVVNVTGPNPDAALAASAVVNPATPPGPLTLPVQTDPTQIGAESTPQGRPRTGGPAAGTA